MTESDVIGQWHHTDGTETTDLHIMADGTFSITNLPEKTILPVTGPGHEIDWSKTLDVQGDWEIRDDDRQYLRIDISPVDGYPGGSTNLYSRGRGSDVLYLQVGPGDDDVDFEFSRVSSGGD